MPSVILAKEGPLARVTLNRPEVRNAINDELIQELFDAFSKIKDDPKNRVVLLSGEGDYFCAGADLNWMKQVATASKTKSDNARGLTQLLSLMNEFPKPVIAKVHGAAIGGGLGLVSVADIVVADEDTFFALAEVKLGLIPAVISPYVIAKMGVSGARRYFLTGERFGAQPALFQGLIHEVVESEDLESRCLQIAKDLIAAGPQAVKACKALIQKVGGSVTQDVRDYTTKKIAELRASPEGQEGIQSFLEKRKPNW